MSKIKNKKFLSLVFLIVTLLTLASLAVFLLIPRKKPKAEIKINTLGFALPDFEVSALEEADLMKLALQSKLIRNNLAVKSLTVPYSEVERELVTSDVFLLTDQIELLNFYLAVSDKKNFKKTFSSLKTIFKEEDGLYKSEIPLPEGKPDSYSANLSLCGLLLEAHVLFSEQIYYDEAIFLQEHLFPYFEKLKLPPAEFNIILKEEESIPDFSASPTPKPSPDTSDKGVDKDMESEKDYKTMKVVELAKVDLNALQQLSLINPDWLPVYENSLQILLQARLDFPGPFFNEGYNPQEGGYLAYLERENIFNLENQLKIALVLGRQNKLPLETYEFFKEFLFNKRALYKEYSVLTGSEISENESIVAYAYLARLARIRKDKSTYDFCVDRIFWNRAGSHTSKIFGLTFEEENDGSFYSPAFYSIEALKSLY